MDILSTKNLTLGYSHKGRTNIVQQDLNISLKNGELVCLIGPNGSGKSTLLRTIAGLQKPLKGKTFIDNKDVTQLNLKEKSSVISLVLTDRIEVENATVRSIVALGRHPYTSWWGEYSATDEKIINHSIEMVHLTDKIDCYLDELSDGERQRAMIAKALAQNTSLIILDEPTAHLDLPNRVEIMLLLHSLAHNTNKSIILSTHELDLALQAADRIWLISQNKGIESGVPEDLVFNGSFDNVFKSKAYVFNASNGNFSMNYSLKKEVWVEGDKTRLYWTLRALARAGYKVIENAKIRIKVTEKLWILENKQVKSIEELLLYLDIIKA